MASLRGRELSTLRDLVIQFGFYEAYLAILGYRLDQTVKSQNDRDRDLDTCVKLF
jgi:hypothetical protein